MGHGVAAAAMMAQLRTALRAYALEGHEPAAVAERLNHLLVPLRPTSMTTLAYVVLDTEHETARMISAGHPPPLLVVPGEAPRYLPVEGDPPLGVVPGAPLQRAHIRAARPTACCVMVTDGAVEVRGETLDAGLERLRALAAELQSPPALCDAVAARQSHEDDLGDHRAARLRAARALPQRLAGRSGRAARAAPVSCAAGCGTWGADADEIYDITVAVQEASANAVEHAYAPGSAAFEVDARHAEGVITVVVHDRGQWRDARGGEQRGRGLPIMQSLMESVDVERSEQGTTVRLSRTLKRASA